MQCDSVVLYEMEFGRVPWFHGPDGDGHVVHVGRCPPPTHYHHTTLPMILGAGGAPCRRERVWDSLSCRPTVLLRRLLRCHSDVLLSLRCAAEAWKTAPLDHRRVPHSGGPTRRTAASHARPGPCLRHLTIRGVGLGGHMGGGGWLCSVVNCSGCSVNPEVVTVCRGSVVGSSPV